VYLFELIAEKKIQEAIKNGEFDNLFYRGKPLPPDDMANVPEELRMAYKIMKNANIVPEEIELNKGILAIQDLMKCCCDENEKAILQLKLNEKQLRYNMLIESRTSRTINEQYSLKIKNKLK